MEIEQIPSDEIILMSESLHRLFCAGGCKPMCHCCIEWISIGNTFKLATLRTIKKKYPQRHAFDSYHVLDAIEGKEVKDPDVVFDETKEVMLCDKCTVEAFQEKQLLRAKEDVGAANELKEYKDKIGGGCFRINGKIVH